jgi:glutamate-ammonia-ligase adenylyltransferase
MAAGKPFSALELSPFLKRLVERYPQWFDELRASGRLQRQQQPAAATLAEEVATHGLDAGLRRFRNREMLRLIWRDLEGLAPVEEVLTDLSVLADACLQAAVNHHSRVFQDRFGIPRDSHGQAQQLVVLGLGKLGGHELNLSSDIDIVFCYPQAGTCDGPRGLANEQFFTRLTRAVIGSLSEVTADGFCFRVDTRLRPFGESGPLVSSFAALEQYYQREGRDWERYALIKARPVAGDIRAGRELLEILKPFVYRRYIDFGAIEALRDMHASVRKDTMSRARSDDIKRGPGGIREIEFLVQAFQLLRGGRERILQTPSLLEAASGLESLKLLPAETTTRLLDCYRFLRRVENRLQALHDQQTHQMPVGEDGLRVARAMGYRDITEFETALRDVRTQVQALFEDSLPQPVTASDATNPWHAHWQGLRSDPQHGGDFAKPVREFARRLNRLSLSQRASRRLDQFMPALLQRLDELGLGEAVVNRVLDLVSAICRRSAYLSLLVQNPEARDRMLELFAASPLVADTVTRHPALLDELIDPSLGDRPPGETTIQAGIQRILDAFTDTETTLQELNYFKLVTGLRIAVAVLRGVVGEFPAMRLLSQLADASIQAVLDLSRKEVESRHGSLGGPELVVIAYGSLGAEAMGFDSDLDLVFLFDPVDGESDGPRRVNAERYHTAVARRMLSLLAASTPSGRLYSIDARLRPNGRAGLLVSSLDAFERYQNETAWTWELQALTRARAVAGNTRAARRFEDIRSQVLTAERDAASINADVRDMRQRIEASTGESDLLKHGHGSLLDIEFIAQLGLLLNAAEHPGIVASTRLDEQLQALNDCNWLDNEQFDTLTDALESLYGARLRRAISAAEAIVNLPPGPRNAQALCDEILR